MKTKVTFQVGKRQESFLLTAEQVGGMFEIIDRGDSDDPMTRHPTLQEIEFAICAYFKISSIKVARRFRDLARYRHLFYYLSCRFYSGSLNEIGEYMGGFDHTTVMHGRDKIKALITGPHPDQIVIDQLNGIKKNLKA